MLRLITLCMIAAALHAQSPRELFERAMSAQKSGDYEGAVESYRAAIKAQPGLLPAWVNLGVSLVQLRQYPEAIESYQRALQIDPNNLQVQRYLALAYFKSGNTNDAVTQFEDLLRRAPADASLATLLAACYMQAGKNDRALRTLQPFAARGEVSPDFRLAWASAQIANGHLTDGAATAEKLAREANSAPAWKIAGETYLKLNDFPRAKDNLEAGAQADASYPGLQTALGQAREKNADYEDAIKAFSAAVQQNPVDFDALLGLGSDQYFTRDLHGARISLGRALALNDKSAPALYAMALVDKSEARIDAAIASLEKAVRLEPKWTEAHIQLAALYVKARRTEDGARERAIVDRLEEEARQQRPNF